MGEIAEMMLNGDMCECCGVWLDDDGYGIPRYCSRQCAVDRGAVTGNYSPNTHKRKPPPPRADKTNCPTCMKRVKIIGLAQHHQDAHGIKL